MLRKITKNLLKQRSRRRNLILVTSGRFSTVFQTKENLQFLHSLLFEGFNVVTSARDKSELASIYSRSRHCSLPVFGQSIPGFPSRCNTVLDDI